MTDRIDRLLLCAVLSLWLVFLTVHRTAARDCEPMGSTGVRLELVGVRDIGRSKMAITYKAHGIRRLAPGVRFALGKTTVNGAVAAVSHTTSTGAQDSDPVNMVRIVAAPRRLRVITLRQQVILKRPAGESVAEFKNLLPNRTPSRKLVRTGAITVQKVYVNQNVSTGDITSVPVVPSRPDGKWKMKFVLGRSGPKGIGVELDTDCAESMFSSFKPFLVTGSGTRHASTGRVSGQMGGAAKVAKGVKYVLLFPAISPSPTRLALVLVATRRDETTWVSFGRVPVSSAGRRQEKGE